MTSECVEWTGGRMGAGYGCLTKDGVRWLAHRFVYTQAHGPIPKGMLVCHKCDNPPCVNLDHLFLGTDLDNLRDMTAKGRHWTKTHASWDVLPHGETHHRAKLSDEQVMEIRSRYAAGGVHQRQLAREFGVSQPMIGYIVRRQNWKHIA